MIPSLYILSLIFLISRFGSREAPAICADGTALVTSMYILSRSAFANVVAASRSTTANDGREIGRFLETE